MKVKADVFVYSRAFLIPSHIGSPLRMRRHRRMEAIIYLFHGVSATETAKSVQTSDPRVSRVRLAFVASDWRVFPLFCDYSARCERETLQRRCCAIFISPSVRRHMTHTVAPQRNARTDLYFIRLPVTPYVSFSCGCEWLKRTVRTTEKLLW